MGRFLAIDDVFGKDSDPRWYVSDLHWDSSWQRYVVQWPNRNFPVMLAIHEDMLKEREDLRVEIRKFVERTMTGDVMWRMLERTYFQPIDVSAYIDAHTARGGYQVHNWYCLFYFESDADAILFKLRFTDYISEIKDKKDD